MGFRSSTDAMNSSLERDANFSPKTKKKLSKKPSFIKNAVMDLFRSKSKSQKVSRQKSLCESDLQQRNQISAPMMPILRREKSDLSEMSIHMRNQQIRNQMLQRSNSSCGKPVLKPILKRQSSFCDERNGTVSTVRDYDAKPVVKNLRRQSSMCEMETEPKVTPLLRRQNSLIEYNRRGIYGQVPSFNLITKIDPIYQRQQQSKHEPFSPTQPLPPEPYQTKDHIIYDPIPKPKRTYSSTYGRTGENPYATRFEVTDQSFESPYGNRQNTSMPLPVDPPYASRAECAQNPYVARTQMARESPYATRNELVQESPYASRNEVINESMYPMRSEVVRENPYATRSEVVREGPYASRNELIRESPYASRIEMARESPYGTRNEVARESPYATRSEVSSENPYATRNEARESSYASKQELLRQRMTSESPYATKEDMLRHRFSESPYNTKEELLKQRMDNSTDSIKEVPYGKRTYDPPSTTWPESPYGVRPERRLHTPVHFPGRISPMSKCMSEPPYATKSEMMARIGHNESPYASRLEVKSSCSDSNYSMQHEPMDLRQEVRPASAECTYVSKQEILNQKAALLATRESTYGTRLEEKLEIIKQRNQAKKDLIYQTRKESNESDSMKIREPIYVSKRELKESVIYESHQETKDPVPVAQEASARNSPYELSDVTHLSRPDSIHNNKLETEVTALTDIFKEIDFSKLRLSESQTDAEKEKSLKLESTVLIGEPLYAPRLHGKAEHISNALKVTTAPIPYESTSSMETQYASECSMNFENKPQSTPYTSQDLDGKASKPSRSVTFCEQIAEKSPETSQENSGTLTISCNETTIIDGQDTIIQNEAAALPSNETTQEVEPDTPHTTWGIFDSEGGVLEDRQWGVSLIIPPKAIAPGVKQKIYFTVSDPRLSQRVGGPPMDMDNGKFCTPIPPHEHCCSVLDCT